MKGALIVAPAFGVRRLDGALAFLGERPRALSNRSEDERRASGSARATPRTSFAMVEVGSTLHAARAESQSGVKPPHSKASRHSYAALRTSP